MWVGAGGVGPNILTAHDIAVGLYTEYADSRQTYRDPGVKHGAWVRYNK